MAAGPVKKWGVTARGPDCIGTTSPCLLMDTKVSLVLRQSQRRVWEWDREWVAADVVLELHVCRAGPGLSGGDGLMVVTVGSFGGHQTTCFHTFRCFIRTGRPTWQRNQQLHFPEVQSS